MVEPIGAEKIDAVAKKLFSVLGTLAGFASLIVSLGQLTPSRPAMAGVAGFNVVLHLSILTAISYGILWHGSEWLFGWHFGAGSGKTLVSGRSAVVLGLSMILPLAVVPPLYELTTQSHILLPLHWQAMLCVTAAGLIAHLVMYGTTSTSAFAIRPRLAPSPQYSSFATGVLIEGIYAALYFSSVVLTYRIVVANASARELLVGRTLAPAATFFFGMTIFITFAPESQRKTDWIQVRGIVSALLMMFCFCWGMFL